MTMKTLLAGTGLAALLAAVPMTPPQIDQHSGLFSSEAQAANVDVDISVFFDTLSPHGRWYRHRTYDYVFIPTGVSAHWSPYTNGHWIYTDRYGWYWASDDPHGWATHHYGRWVYDGDVGWVWVPGNVWAPAWVKWQRNDDYVGWAPLPARGAGFAFGVAPADAHFEVDVNFWNFVEIGHFADVDLQTVIIAHDHNHDIWDDTRPLGHVHYADDAEIAVNFFIEIDDVEERSGHRVRRAEVESVDDPSAVREETDGDDGRIAAFQQELAEDVPEEEPEEVASDEEVQQMRAEREAAAEEETQQKAEGQVGTEEGQNAEAESNSQAGDEQSAEAEGNAQSDDEQKAEAEGNAESGDEQSAEAEAEDNAQDGDEQKAEAEGNAQSGDKQKAEAEGNAPSGDEQSAEAEGNAQSGDEQSAEAEGNAQAGDEQSAEAEGNAQAGDESAEAQSEAQAGAEQGAEAEANAQAGAKPSEDRSQSNAQSQTDRGKSDDGKEVGNQSDASGAVAPSGPEQDQANAEAKQEQTQE